jgi:RNA polymerase sigma factor (sigma-70 family)
MGNAGAMKSDEQLLGEFAATRNDQAFAEIVRRHGGLVLGVCRRMLGEADAEDAAQAVLLTLARKAATVRSAAQLAGWLHHVAWQVCLDVRKSAQRRRRYEQEARAMVTETPVAPPDQAETAELRRGLDEALEALPAKYRLPLMLHYLRGLSKEETAQLLKANTGTISARLDRGREMLRQRLARHGAVLSAVALTGLLSETGNAVELGETFVLATTRAARLTRLDPAQPGLPVSVHAIELAKGALRTLFWARVRKVALAGVAACLLVSVAGLAAYRAMADDTVAKTRVNHVGRLIKQIHLCMEQYMANYREYPPIQHETYPAGDYTPGVELDNTWLKERESSFKFNKDDLDPVDHKFFIDPWKNRIRYRKSSPDRMLIWSLGPDGKDQVGADTTGRRERMGDDITNMNADY